MTQVKRKICLITNWYPTKENLYQGVFFKEQAEALEGYFDFIVIHYSENVCKNFLEYFVRYFKGKLNIVNKVHEEKNTIEYNVEAYYTKSKVHPSKWNILFSKCVRFVGLKKRKKEKISAYQQRITESLIKAIKNNFSEEIDVLYCVNAQTESYILQCVSNVIGKPYIVSEHAPFPYPGDIITNVEKNAIEQADLFFAISYDKIRQVMMQNVQPKKIAYVGNYVNENQFQLNNKKNDIKTFIMVAANSFYKNYNLFIDIFERLTEITDRPFNIIIVGYGANKGYSQDKSILEERIKKSKFAGYAELIPEVRHEEIHEIYKRADAFVMTSVQEGMPVSALEAGCCGLPIFSTMCGGVEDYVDDKIGRIYKIIDSESFANGLKEYLEGRIEFDSAYIRQCIVDKFGKKAFTSRMVKYITEVIEETEK